MKNKNFSVYHFSCFSVAWFFASDFYVIPEDFNGHMFAGGPGS